MKTNDNKNINGGGGYDGYLYVVNSCVSGTNLDLSFNKMINEI